MASYASRPSPKQRKPRDDGDPLGDFGAYVQSGIRDAGASLRRFTDQAMGAAKNVYGGSAALVPGRLIHAGFRKVKGALDKATRRR